MKQIAKWMMALSAPSFLSSAQAGGIGPTTVDQLTCERAIASVARDHRYYVGTPDGAIPIYPIIPVNNFSPCTGREVVSAHIVKTRDNPRCLVGYSCRPSWTKNSKD